MSGMAELTAEQLAGLSRGTARVQQGTCKSMDWANGRAIINISGGEVPVAVVDVAPTPGRQVWVMYVGDSAVCLGMVPRAAMGVIQTAASGGRIKVLGDDGESYTIPYLGAAPGVGNRVAIDWTRGGNIAGALSAEPEGSEYIPPATAPPSSETRTITINPTGSGSFSNSGGSWFNTSVAADAYSRGAYFYGTQIRDSIPAGATIVSAAFFAAFELAQFAAVQIGASTVGGKSGPPNISGPSVSIGLSSGWKDIGALMPTLRADGLSIATANTGYSRLSAAGVANAGALSIVFRT